MSKSGILGYVPYGTGTFEPFNQVFNRAIKVTPEYIKAGRVDALVIWGGEDISPSLYGEKAGPHTSARDIPSRRDIVEVDVCKAAIEAGILIIGICRGAQLLCALAGGKLIQHVTGHHGDHEIITYDGKTLVTSSVHHQMMYPWDTKHKLIAETPHLLNHYPIVWELDEDFREPEIVYFPNIKGLAIQGHPEFMNAEDEFVLYCNQLVREYL